MQHKVIPKVIVCLTLAAVAVFVQAQDKAAAKIKMIEGRAEFMRKGSEKWLTAKPNMYLAVGDRLYTHQESIVELEFSSATIVRLDANTIITIEECSQKKTKASSSVGRIWINAKKLLTTKNEFEIVSPTAVAAVRGTSFSVSTSTDSTTQVAVYKGAVAVGPASADSAAKKPLSNVNRAENRFEISGPEEIPGPYEVSLEEWISIVAGQMISVRKDGKYSMEKFDTQKAAEDEFIKRCMDWDKAMEMIKEKK